jgi:hypothetical protein
MKMNLKPLIFPLVLALSPLFAQTGTGQTPAAQTFVTIANEGDTVTFTTAGLYSFGALSGTTTVAPKIVCSATTRDCFKNGTVVAGGTIIFNSNFQDPAPGVTKILQVVQVATAQSGTVKSAATGIVAPWSVPALSVPAPTIPALTLTLTGPTIATPIILKLGGTLGWCTFISANDSGNYGIALSGCLMPPPSK